MKDLFEKYINNKCSPEEVQELLKHFALSENEIKLRRLISEQLEADHASANKPETKWEQDIEQTYDGIRKQIEANKRMIPIYKKKWFRLAAAATFLIGLLVSYKFITNYNSQTGEIVKINSAKQKIVPGSNKAVLTLADGSKITLDSTANGVLTRQGNTKISKQNGLLVYNIINEKPDAVLYNTVSTPQGGQYQLVLADDSKVWLNSASSIRFPNTFTGNERKVEITGEAYFEVSRNESIPFKVEVNGAEVEVLGTHFNINAYEDEEEIKTTLLEGSVKVSNGSGNLLLTPGQQARINKNGEIKIIKDADIDEAVAWKNGRFIFQENNIQSVMRQLARWYDVDVYYRGNVTDEEFVGVINRSRYENISQILQMLEKTRTVSFDIDGHNVTVMPYNK